MSEKVDFTFSFWRNHFKSLISAILVIAGPFVLLGGGISGYFSSEVLFGVNQITATFSSLIGVLFTSIGGMFVLYYTLLYVKVFLETNEVPTFKILWERKEEVGLGNMLLSMLGLSVILLFGFLFLIIPGVYMSVVFSLLLPVMVFEKKSFNNALSRSSFLIKENWWSSFGFYFAIGTVAGIIGVVVNSVPNMFMIFGASQQVDGGELPFYFQPLIILLTMVASLIAFMINTVNYVALAVNYFSLLEDKEAVSLKDEILTME
ncbi:hypothetical protein V6R21_22300 [Limibacter armeniacum]|uniref:hypothetical protein n=1 Tax=Limibacter armeniacum TaxID=466084 RepID=UPI002FE5C6F3